MAIRISRQDSQTEPEPETVRPKLVFPQGTRALFKTDDKGNRSALTDDEKVWLVNCSLSNVAVRDRDPVMKPKDGKFHEISVPMRPLSNHEFTVQYARRALANQESAGKPSRLVVAPPDGNCKGEMKFTAFEREWETCPFGKCGHHGALPPNTYWSVWHAQHLISWLGKEDAIQRFLEEFDLRPAVNAWGLEHASRRIRARAERLGLSTGRRSADVTF